MKTRELFDSVRNLNYIEKSSGEVNQTINIYECKIKGCDLVKSKNDFQTQKQLDDITKKLDCLALQVQLINKILNPPAKFQKDYGDKEELFDP